MHVELIYLPGTKGGAVSLRIIFHNVMSIFTEFQEQLNLQDRRAEDMRDRINELNAQFLDALQEKEALVDRLYNLADQWESEKHSDELRDVLQNK